jgi:hypothetical protein
MCRAEYVGDLHVHFSYVYRVGETGITLAGLVGLGVTEMALKNARVQQDKEKLHVDASQRLGSSGKSFSFGKISITSKV